MDERQYLDLDGLKLYDSELKKVLNTKADSNDLTNFYTKQEVTNIVSNKADKSELTNFYTKTEVDNLISNVDIGDNVVTKGQDNEVTGVDIISAYSDVMSDHIRPRIILRDEMNDSIGIVGNLALAKSDSQIYEDYANFLDFPNPEDSGGVTWTLPIISGDIVVGVNDNPDDPEYILPRISRITGSSNAFDLEMPYIAPIGINGESVLLASTTNRLELSSPSAADNDSYNALSYPDPSEGGYFWSLPEKNGIIVTKNENDKYMPNVAGFVNESSESDSDWGFFGGYFGDIASILSGGTIGLTSSGMLNDGDFVHQLKYPIAEDSTEQREWTLPDKSGTIALLSDITGGGGVSQEELDKKADKITGDTITDTFYTRITGSDSTGSKYEIVEELGSIQKLGGMTYKSENLSTQSTTKPLNTGYFNTTQGTFGYVEKGKKYTFSAYYISSSVTNINLGLRAMSNSDGTGTNLGNLQSIALTTGKRTSCTFTAAYSGYIGLTGSNFGATDTLSDITLNEGSVDLGYTPYFTGLRDTKVTEIISSGNNLLNPSKIIASDGTATQQTDGSFISKSLSQYTSVFLNNVYVASIGGTRSSNGIELKKGTYYVTLKAKLNSGTMNTINAIFCVREKVSQIASTWISKPNITSEYQTYYAMFTLDTDDIIGFSIQADYYASNAVIQFKDIMISHYDMEYEPYWEDVIEIPQEVVDLDGYGVGINDEYYNYVDFQNKKFVKLVGSYTFNGGEYFGQANTNKSGTYRYYTSAISSLIEKASASNVKGIMLISDLNTITADQGYTAIEGVSVDTTGRLYFFKNDIQSTTDMANYLTNKTIHFALASPEEIDLSNIKLDSTYRVANMGVETLVNEYKQAAPTEILYGVDIIPQVIENSDNIAKIKTNLKQLETEINELSNNSDPVKMIEDADSGNFVDANLYGDGDVVVISNNHMLGLGSTQYHNDNNTYHTLCYPQFEETGGETYYWNLPKKSGTIALTSNINQNPSLFILEGRTTISANNGYVNLSSLFNKYNELMIVVRAVVNGATTIGISNTTSGSSGFLCSTSVSGTSYVKVTMNKTSEGYFAWNVGSSFGWSASSENCYLRVNSTAATSISCSVVIHGRK